jgi:Protein of unknown function DUF262/Protein of unknown function (DUF1524)
MSTGNVTGRAYGLKELFERSFYQIDFYQREYAWSADDVRILMEDLFEAFEETWQGGRRRRHRNEPDRYFLGPFVYIEEPRSVRFLVDGQQRFTTLHLIFLHLRRMAQQLRQNEAIDKLSRVIGEYQGRRLRFRIDIEERRELLEALYHGRDFEPRLGAPISVRNMSYRSGLIGDLLDSRLTADALPSFIDWLLNDAVLVGIRAGSKAGGFKIFESMNDRGARLTHADLVKSFLISRAGAHEDELNQRWRDMLARVTTDREDANAPKEFLRTILVAHHVSLAEGKGEHVDEIDASLSGWVRKNYEGELRLREGDDFFDFADDLLHLAEHYVRFAWATKRPYFEDDLGSLFYNSINGLHNQLAVVLAPVKPRDTPTVAKAKAALVANYIDRQYVARTLNEEPVDSRDFDADFWRLIPELRSCRTPKEVVTALAPSLPSDSFESIWNFRLRGNNRAQVRYLLARLTAYVEVGCGKRDESESYLSDDRSWQIEHLWPNRPDQHRSDYEDPIAFSLARSRIGALVLLHRRDNASLKDLPFIEKVSRYGRQANLTAILTPGHQLNNTFVKDFVADNGIGRLFHDFGPATRMPAVIESRTRLYRALCNRIWSAERLGFPSAPRDRQHLTGQDVPVSIDSSRRARPTPNPRTDLARLVKAGIVAPETELIAETEKYTAAVDDGGILWLPTGDPFVAVDEAGKAVSGESRCDGLKFWRVRMPDGSLISLRALRDKAKADGRLTAAPRRR